MVKVKFFASLAERIGRKEAEIEHSPGMTVGDAWRHVTGRDTIDDELLMAVNLDYSRADDPVQDGDEVAFFPPVTGG